MTSLVYIFRLLHRLNQQIEARISLTWSAFAKLKPILTSPKPTMKFKLCLFIVACTLILLYGCKAWVLMQALPIKLANDDDDNDDDEDIH